MKKLKLQPLVNAKKKLSRKKLKNIFGGEAFGSGNATNCGCPNNISL